MRDLLAQTSQAVEYIPFLNLQYLYCFFVSLFGGSCNPEVGAVDVEVPTVEGVGDIATTTAQAADGFWSWLWPFGGGQEVAVSTTTATESTGFWTGIVSSVPDPVLAVFSAIGTVISFLWTVFSWLSYSVSALFFIAITAALVGLILIRMKEWSTLGTLPPRPTGKSYGWSRWQDLLDASMAVEPKRWREAILAADGMLGELLTKLGYHGETTHEQLRSVPEGAFVTLSQAWEAHRIRNFVAQRNSNFILTQREAFRVLKLYEQVFEEFDFI